VKVPLRERRKNSLNLVRVTGFYNQLLLLPAVLYAQPYVHGQSGKITTSNGGMQTRLSLDSYKTLAIANNCRIKEAASEVSQSEQAKENLKVTRDNYEAGVTRMSDLLEAQSVYQGALNSLTEAKCNYQIAKAKYMQAINNYK
jgi:hypothetical protein